MKKINAQIIAQALAPNKNKRMYTAETLAAAAEIYNKRQEHNKLGMLGMAEDTDVHLDKVSHRVENLRMAGHYFIGDVTILETPSGKILQTMLDNNQVEFRMAGLGRYTHMGDGVMEVTDFNLISINAVAPDNAA